jgi:hypothetical protein
MSTVSRRRGHPTLVAHLVYAPAVAGCATLTLAGHQGFWWVLLVITFPVGLVMYPFVAFYGLLLIGGEPGNDAVVVAVLVVATTAITSVQLALYLRLARRLGRRGVG